jgi:hypothetical protein
MRWFSRVLSTSSRAAHPDHPTRPALRLESLEGRDVPTVSYFGGNLLPHVEAQAVFYGNEWSAPTASQPTPATIDGSLRDLVGGAYMDALTRAGYGVGRGSASSGVIDHTALTAGSTITDASIQARLQADIKSGLLQAPDANRLYVVYVQPNVAVNLGAGQGTTQQGILGYHGAFGGTTATGAPVTIRYAVVAYPGGAAGNSSLGTSATDQLTAVASHELAEAATDPDVNYSQLGWYDPRRGEIGDITENNPNALVRLDGYLVQLVSDRNDQLLTLAVPPTVPPPPPPPPVTNPATSATTTTISASPVHYSWFSASVTLTVTVRTASGASVPAGGTVALFYNGSVIALGTVRVVNGVSQVSFAVQFGYYGNYTFAAEYLGSGAYLPSASNSTTVTV